MLHRLNLLAGLFLAVFAINASQATAQNVTVVEGFAFPRQATSEFKLPETPPVSAEDAGNIASAKLVAGTQDFNSGPLRVLFDGAVPQHQDEPQSNFFLAGNDPGKLLIDIGREVELRQFNTYSWHPFLRGPQVYTLYGYTGPVAGDEEPTVSENLEDAASGWAQIAEVDTRRKFADAGGQYGVSVRAANDGVIGKYRYLLMAISSTDDRRRDSQTFYSEIDIVDGQTYEKKKNVRQVDVLDIDGKYQISFDTTEVPEVRGWVDDVLKPICKEWYPKIARMLPSEGYEAPDSFTIYFHKDMSGVANASGRRINCAGPWFLRNLNGEAPGSVVHEMVHIVQQYSGRRGRNRNPGWMVEGVADYIRWFLYEPEKNRPRPNPRRANYDDSYRTTAAFLNFVMNQYDKKLVEKMNVAMREGRYSDSLWTEITGKNPDVLWDEYVKTLDQ